MTKKGTLNRKDKKMTEYKLLSFKQILEKLDSKFSINGLDEFMFNRKVNIVCKKLWIIFNNKKDELFSIPPLYYGDSFTDQIYDLCLPYHELYDLKYLDKIDFDTKTFKLKKYFKKQKHIILNFYIFPY